MKTIKEQAQKDEKNEEEIKEKMERKRWVVQRKVGTNI